MQEAEVPKWNSNEDVRLIDRSLRKMGSVSGGVQHFFDTRHPGERVARSELLKALEEHVLSVGEDTHITYLRILSAVEMVKLGSARDALLFMHLYNVCCYFGAFSAGQVIRSKARAAIIYFYLNASKSYDNKVLNRFAVAAALETGDLDIVVGYLNRRDVALERSPLAKALRRIGKGGQEPYQPSTEEARYADSIAGKPLVIVGPASGAVFVEESTEADSSVVTMNDKSATIRGFGDQRNYISYYNGEQLNGLLTKGMLPPARLNWVCVKNASQISQLPSFMDERAETLRGFSRCNLLMLNGTPNALPNIVYDLAPFSSPRIEITGCDFMMTVLRQPGYVASGERSHTYEEMSRIFRRSCASSHDPISQFLLFKTMLENLPVVPDQRLREVLAMDERVFAAELERRYKSANGGLGSPKRALSAVPAG